MSPSVAFMRSNNGPKALLLGFVDRRAAQVALVDRLQLLPLNSVRDCTTNSSTGSVSQQHFLALILDPLEKRRVLQQFAVLAD